MLLDRSNRVAVLRTKLVVDIHSRADSKFVDSIGHNMNSSHPIRSLS